MTCCFRILGRAFERAGIRVTSDNKDEVDKVIHRLVRKRYKNCPAVGREVKKRIAEDEDGFARELRRAWLGRGK